MTSALEAGARLIARRPYGCGIRPQAEAVLDRAGVSDRVDVVRKFSSYNWWLKQEIERGEARLNSVCLDGAKGWTIDGLAVVLIGKVLRPGGWGQKEDLGWTYASKSLQTVTDGVTVRGLSERPRDRKVPQGHSVQANKSNSIQASWRCGLRMTGGAGRVRQNYRTAARRGCGLRCPQTLRCWGERPRCYTSRNVLPARDFSDDGISIGKHLRSLLRCSTVAEPQGAPSRPN